MPEAGAATQTSEVGENAPLEDSHYMEIRALVDRGRIQALALAGRLVCKLRNVPLGMSATSIHDVPTFSVGRVVFCSTGASNGENDHPTFIYGFWAG